MIMMTSRRLRRVALGMLVVVPLLGLAAWKWAIPAAIVAAIQAKYTGHVAIKGWWIDGTSAGVTGLVLRETPEPNSPAWARVDRVSTDLTPFGLIRGKFVPDRIEFVRPTIDFQITADGRPKTTIPMKSGGGGALPTLAVRDGTLTMRQEGREAMVIRRLGGTLGPSPEGPRYEAKADDPEWGHPVVEGRFTPDFAGYSLHMTAEHLPADLEKARRIPFIEEKVWDFVQPTGPIGVVLDYRYAPPVHEGGKKVGAPSDPAMPGTISMETTAIFEGTSVELPTLGLSGRDATGKVLIRDKIVTLEGVRGRMCDGRVEFAGPLNFRDKPDSYDLKLKLNDVDLTALPSSWQLHRLGVRGRFTGKADLRMVMQPAGIDLTGTDGEGVVAYAEIRGIPLKHLALRLRGEGLRAGVNPENLKNEGPFLPQWVRGEFRVKDVDLDRSLARLETPKHPEGGRPLPVTGRLDLAAEIRMPLGSLNDWKAYRADGNADIAGVQIGSLDLGRLSGQMKMSEGIIEVADLRGRLLNRPGGGGRPPSTEPAPARGPLPHGGFRGQVRIDLAADEPDFKVDFEGSELPIAELATAAPSLSTSRPASQSPPEALPLSGRLTIRASAHGRGPSPSDPRVWNASGQAEMPEVAYDSTVAHDVRARLSVERGHLTLTDLSGRLGGASFKGRFGLDLFAPYAYDGDLQTSNLPASEAISIASKSSGSAKEKIRGTIAVEARAGGRMKPWQIASDGRAKLTGLEYGQMVIGNVPVRWSTKGESIQITAEEHQRFGGLVSAEARLPVDGLARPIEGTFLLKNVDTTELARQVDSSGSIGVTGHAHGQGRFKYAPAEQTPGTSDLPISAEAHLTAPDLKVGGVPARGVKVALTMHEGNPRFEISAEGMGGTIRMAGDGHLSNNASDERLRAELEAIGLNLYEIWTATGAAGAVTDLRGVATVRGHGRAVGGLDLAHTHGEATIRLDELIYGFDYRLTRQISAGVSKSPEGWRIGPMDGELFGGRISGRGVWASRGSDGQDRYGADLRIDNLMLARVLSFIPEAERRFAAAGTLRVSGRADGSGQGSLEFRVDRGQINGLMLEALHVPGDWSISRDGTPNGSLHVRRAGGKLAGGRIGGEAHFAVGNRRDFRARLTVDDVDLRILSREEMGTRSVPGRLSGFASIYGTDPANPTSYRGEMVFDLDQASLVDIPLLDELDRSLGSTGGGVFDDGDIHATIAERKLYIQQLTLVGPLMQVHATGTMHFDGRLNLEVVVNNTRGVYQSGQAIMARSPDVADEVARRASQIDQVRDFVSSRLMKFRISGTIRDPIVNTDRSINPGAAMGFFLKTMTLSARSQ